MLFLTLVCAHVAAQTPGTVPLMGQVTHGGVPLHGTHALTVALYAAPTGGDPWWDDEFSAEFSAGLFAISLGTGEEDLDLERFGDHPDLWVQITVDGGAPSERWPIGRSPFAAHAVRASDADKVGGLAGDQVASLSDLTTVETDLSQAITDLGSALSQSIADLAAQVAIDISGASSALDLRLTDVEDRTAELETNFAVGMIAFFPGACPSGWTEYTAGRGRFVVGVPNGGTVTGTQGTALGNLGTVAITQVPAHSHVVDPPATSSGTESVGHTHNVDPGAFNTSTAGHHAHTLAQSVSAGEDDDNMISGWNNFSNGDVPRTDWWPTTQGAGDHTHSVDVPNTTSGGASAAHTHSTDISAFNSATSGVASVDVTMPYIQLRMCQFQGT